MDTPRTSRTLRRSLRLLSAVAVAAVPFAMASSASAINEFPAHPHVAFEASCTDSGLLAKLTFTNPAGLSSAHFAPSLDGVAQAAVDVATDATVVKTYPMVEGAAGVFVIGASDSADIVQTVGPAECYSAAATIVVTCSNGVGQLVATVDNTGKSGQIMTFTLTGEASGPEPLVIEGLAQHVFTRTLAEDAAYSASVSSIVDGTLATASGTVDCVPAETTTTIAATTTTIAPTTTVEAPSTTIPATLPVIEQLPVSLPETGSTSTPAVILGSLATITGVVIRRVVRRPVG